MTTPRLIVLDDELEMARFVADATEIIGFEVTIATHARQLREAFAQADYDVAVIDIFMPDTDGFELIQELAEQGCETAIILISGKDDSLLQGAAKIAESSGLHVLGALTKPFSVADMEIVLNRLKRTRDERSKRDVR